MKKKQTIKQTVAAIERHKREIAKHRDALRDIYEDLEAVLDSADEGVRSLDDAVELLSRYV